MDVELVEAHGIVEPIIFGDDHFYDEKSREILEFSVTLRHLGFRYKVIKMIVDFSDEVKNNN